MPTITTNCDFTHLASGTTLKKVRARTNAPIDLLFFNNDVPYHGMINKRPVHLGTVLPSKKGTPVELHHIDKPLVGVIVGVYNYRSGVNHAIGAVKFNKILYVCDPIGKASDKALVNKVTKQVAEHYGCKRVMIYNGPNLQRQNSCVGYSSNFIATLLKYFQTPQNGGHNFDQKYYNNEMYRTLSSNVGMVFGKGSEESIMKSLERRPTPSPKVVSKRILTVRRKPRKLGPVKGGIKKR